MYVRQVVDAKGKGLDAGDDFALTREIDGNDSLSLPSRRTTDGPRAIEATHRTRDQSSFVCSSGMCRLLSFIRLQNLCSPFSVCQMSCRNRIRQVDQKKLLESCSHTNMARIHAPIVASTARSHTDHDAPRIGRVKRRVPVPVFLLNLTAHPFPASYGEVSGARPNKRPACRLRQLHRQIAFRLSHPASSV